MIRIGIICPSEIAFRRFLPAIKKASEFKYVGVAIATKEEWFGEKAKSISDDEFLKIKNSELEKAKNFEQVYGGKIFQSYDEMITSGEIDAIYIPLPPALHYKWAKAALVCGLHTFVEKPSTTSLKDTAELVKIASKCSLALHENYMFIYHSQLETIENVVKTGLIGDVRLFRIDFGFPQRPVGDFRYNKKLGGGALMDCGGYTLKYANMLLGGEAELVCANSFYKEDFEVDIAGAATLKNSKGEAVQISFGMDNDYRCSIDIWGSKGTLKSGRILTAPEGFEPSYTISKNGQEENFKMEVDDTFYKSIMRFRDCICTNDAREEGYKDLIKQAELVEEFKNKSEVLE